MSKKLVFFSLIFAPALALDPVFSAKENLFCTTQQMPLSLRVQKLETMYQQNQCYDLQSLEALGESLLLKYQANSSPEDQMLTLHALSLLPQFVPSYEWVEKVAEQKNEYALQLKLLQLMTQWQKEEYDPLFISLVQQSPFLDLRIHALEYLAQKKSTHASGLLESLMKKLPKEIYPTLIPLIVSMDLPFTHSLVKNFIESDNNDLKCMTLLAIGYTQKELFLHYIRDCLTHTNLIELEAAITAVGFFKDMESYNTLKSLANSTTPSIALASWVSLTQMGDVTFLDKIKQKAAQGDLLAISALGYLEKGQEVLEQCMLSASKEVSYNATISLSNMGSPVCLQKMHEILCKNTPLYLLPVFSPGRSFLYWKLHRKIPSANAETQLKIQKELKQALVQKLTKQPLPHLLEMVQKILEEPIEELVPSIIHALTQLEAPEYHKLLQKYVTYKTPSVVRIPALIHLYKNQPQSTCKKHLLKWANDFIKAPKTQAALQTASFCIAPPEELFLFYSIIKTLSQNSSEECVSYILRWLQETPEPFYPILGAFLLLSIE